MLLVCFHSNDRKNYATHLKVLSWMSHQVSGNYYVTKRTSPSQKVNDAALMSRN